MEGMRLEILQLLREHYTGYLSGEQLSQQLQVSRTAIWKHIKALRQAGYTIESSSRLGYRLLTSPDLLLPEELCRYLTTAELGQTINYFTSVDSTNTVAKRLANEQCSTGTVVVAEEQTGGRGRLERGWYSPLAKGLWFSVVLRPQFLPQDAPKCTLLAAVAAVRAMRKLGAECSIKWPNDIVYQGKKLAGILTEMNAEMDAINYIVVGMGLNINISAAEFPLELQPIAISLQDLVSAPVSRVKLLAAILAEFEQLYIVAATGFEPILAEWRELSATLGQTVDVYGFERNFSGVAIDIDQDGALLVQTAAGIERVLAGDVSIRPRIKDKGV